MASTYNLNPQQDSLTSARQLLRRSNALRIKSNNLDLLPCSLRESLLALRNSLKNSKKLEEEELTLLEQIKRGVKLRPVVRRYDTNSRPLRTRRKNEDQDQTDRDNDQDESISNILIEVLRRRYLAIQHSDDDDHVGDEESEMSSIESGGRCGGGAATDASGPRPDEFVGSLVGSGCGANRPTRTVQHKTVKYCVLYGSGLTMTRDSRSQRQGDRQRQQQQQRPCHGLSLMERLSGDSSSDTNERLAGKTPAGKLTNDLIVRL